jgi:predicted DNA-binding transcriptional regulator AlpA
MNQLHQSEELKPPSHTVPVPFTEPEAAQTLPSAEVMTMDEAARFLSISSRTLERYVREAAVPYTPLPRRGARVSVRFLRSQLVKWLQQRTVRPDRWKTVNSRA